MKEYTFEELGYFTASDCQKIKAAMDGKTYMNFTVEYSSQAGNCTLICKTDYDDTADNIKAFFLHCLITEYASLIK